jgi:hypothetical protein
MLQTIGYGDIPIKQPGTKVCSYASTCYFSKTQLITPQNQLKACLHVLVFTKVFLCFYMLFGSLLVISAIGNISYLMQSRRMIEVRSANY